MLCCAVRKAVKCLPVLYIEHIVVKSVLFAYLIAGQLARDVQIQVDALVAELLLVRVAA